MPVHRLLRDEAPARYPWFRTGGRRERPLYLLVGRRGHGKTMLAADVVLNRMRRGERVYTNFDVTDWRRGLRAGRVSSLLDLVDLRDASVVIDEANKWASAREWASMPSVVIGRWQESRKAGLSLLFTTQHESRVDVTLRQLVDEVGVCSRIPFIPRRLPLFRVQWVALEDVNECRRGEIEAAEIWWASADVRFSYSTEELVADVDRAALKAYTASLKDGLDHSQAVEFVGVGGRRDPARFDPVSRSWVEWGDGRSLLRGYRGSTGTD